MKLLALSCILLGTMASGATIGTFTATPAVGSTFSTLIFTSSFANNVATVTNGTISCTNGEGCSGNILTFTLLASGVTSASPLVFAIDGNLSGSATAIGTLTIPGLVTNSPFNLTAGAFNTTILSTILPGGAIPGGNLSIVGGSIGLSLASGQTLTLPSSLTITVNQVASVPEPGTMTLLGAGLIGLGIAARRRVQSA